MTTMDRVDSTYRLEDRFDREVGSGVPDRVGRTGAAAVDAAAP